MEKHIFLIYKHLLWQLAEISLKLLQLKLLNIFLEEKTLYTTLQKFEVKKKTYPIYAFIQQGCIKLIKWQQRHVFIFL